ncbi:MAG TPA: PAS domain S-box protein, partial [Syntrophales bacterium]
DGGKVVGLMGIARNITERKRVEETLRESEERFSVAFRVNPAPMTISTIDDGVVLDANDRWLSMLGYARDEMIGQETAKLSIWLDYEARASFVRKFLKQGFLRGELVQLRTKSGEIRDTLWSAELIKYTGKDVVLSLLYDITDHKQAEEALREAHRRLDEIIEFLPDATFVVQADGKVIAWNKAIEQMTGVSKAAMIGKGEYEYALPFYGERRPLLIDLALLEDPEFEKSKYDITQRAADTIYAEAYVPKTYGGKGAYLSGSASRLRNSAGNIVGAIESIRDATQRKRTENELAKYREGLEQLVAERTQGLEDKKKSLEELNISLKVLLRHREEDKKELEDRFISNVKSLILPYVEKIKSGALDTHQKSCLDIIESNLNEIITPFMRTMRHYSFTPKELTVASLIKDGKTTKEIAEILGVGTHAIDSHRNRIRKKIGLSTRRSNLQSHLRSLE